MARVPRHRFVPLAYRPVAHADRALPIGYGQSISQPYVVALMTTLLELEPGHRVLEVGTGSGYQTAVLAELGAHVFTVEILEPLATTAAERLRTLHYSSVEVRVGDGYLGWPEKSPFDAIIVTAAPDHVPPPLVEQLRVHGRMVIPIGPPFADQTLWRIRRLPAGTVMENVTGVVFVPLVRSGQSEPGGPAQAPAPTHSSPPS